LRWGSDYEDAIIQVYNFPATRGSEEGYNHREEYPLRVVRCNVEYSKGQPLLSAARSTVYLHGILCSYTVLRAAESENGVHTFQRK
jgi:hypothetical protein